MERVMSVEDRIRRAEEIYLRRKQGEMGTITKGNVNNKKNFKLFKKMLIQLLICVAIYLIIYTIYNKEYVFSEDFINKTNEILSYDTNFEEIYNMIKDKFGSFMNINKEEIQNDEDKDKDRDNEKEKENINENNNDKEENQIESEVNQDAIGGAGEGISNESILDSENIQEQQSISQEEQDVQDIKNTTSFIKPVDGEISSKFGQRNTATGSVPKNHTGVDIAVGMGTKIKSATEGEVVLASDQGDYRKTS